MFEKTEQCITNCLQTDLGSHVFYRGFGLNVVDGTNVPMRKDILVQLSTYYPETTLQDVVIERVESNGEYYYTVSVKE